MKSFYVCYYYSSFLILNLINLCGEKQNFYLYLYREIYYYYAKIMKNSSEISFSFIYRSYYKRAFSFAKSYVHDEAVAEDLASEALIALWEKTKVTSVEEVAPLLLTILKNKALDWLKHEQVKASAFESLADWQSRELSLRISSLEACSPEEIFSSEIGHIVRQTLSQLPEQTRRVFVMSRFREMSNREIAEALGISVKGVEYHISKALKVLRVSLKDYLPLLIVFFPHFRL